MSATQSPSPIDSATKQLMLRLRQAVTQVEHTGQILSRSAELVPDIVGVAEAPFRSRSGRDAYRQMTYRQLDEWARKIALGLQRLEAPPGARIALMVRPGVDFVALVFGLMKAGLVSVLIDPGMGKRNLVRCLSEVEPDGIIGVARAQWLRIILKSRFSTARFNVGVGCRWPGLRSLADFRSLDSEQFREPKIRRDDPASIIFTTGSTGVPKGVLYRHRHFIHQSLEIGRFFEFVPGSVDVSGFPLFALFNAAMGATTVFPRMDYTRPAKVPPRHFIAALDAWKATQSFGSPALWNTISKYCEQRRISLTTLRCVSTAGAPVPVHVLKRCQKILSSSAEVFTPYGATEALPVACIGSREVLRETAAQTANGAGTCVGKPFPEMQWRVIAISDDPIASIQQTTTLEPRQIGELIVRGPVVTDAYVTQLWSNALHKISDGTTIWHRMGDVGYLDDRNRFWFCGRKSQRVQTNRETLFTIPCEAIFNQHPAIYRSALVGVGPLGQQIPVVIAEPWPEHWPRTGSGKKRLIAELQARARAHPLTRTIERIHLRKALPVDIRHNAKIFRERLARWAARRYHTSAERLESDKWR